MADREHAFPESAQTIPPRATFDRVGIANVRHLIGKEALFLDKRSGTYRACVVEEHDNPETVRVRLRPLRGPPDPDESGQNERTYECANGRCARLSAFRCSACSSAWYCSRRCVDEHWQHAHHRHCAEFVESQSVERRTLARVPFDRICVWRTMKHDQPYPIWLTGMPKSGTLVMCRNGPRRKFEAATLVHSDDESATVRFAKLEHVVKLKDVFKHIPRFVERNPFRRYEYEQVQPPPLEPIAEEPIDGDSAAAPAGAARLPAEIEGVASAALSREALVAQQAVQYELRPFPDHLYYMDPVDDEDDERVDVPDGYDEAALCAEDFDNILAIDCATMERNTFLDHPAMNTHNVVWQEALVAATGVIRDGRSTSEIDIKTLREQLRGVRPHIVNGQKVANAASFRVPVRKARIDIVKPTCIAQPIDAVVDGGSSIEAISKAARFRHRPIEC